MTDDRTPFREARDAGLVKRHEQRLARAQVCKNCGKPIAQVNWASGPGWWHADTRRSLCEHLRATPLTEETP